MSVDVEDVMVEDMIRRVTETENSDLSGLLGDSGFVGGVKDISNHKAKVTVFNSETGEPLSFPAVYLAKTLKKRRGGKPAFVMAHPDTGLPLGTVPDYKPGTLKCFLHPESEDREWLESIGIGREIVCGDHETAPAGSMKSEFQRAIHEKKKHPISFGVREDAKQRQKEAEIADRAERQIAAMMAMAGGKQSVFSCRIDGCDRFFDSEPGRTLHEGKHPKE